VIREAGSIESRIKEIIVSRTFPTRLTSLLPTSRERPQPATIFWNWAVTAGKGIQGERRHVDQDPLGLWARLWRLCTPLVPLPGLVPDRAAAIELAVQHGSDRRRRPAWLVGVGRLPDTRM
jgi:hypothetical protein